MADYNRRFLVVGGRIKRLIGANPAQLSPSATAMLAQLRHGIAREPGSLPEIWSITLDGIPEEFSQTRRTRGTGDPSRPDPIRHPPTVPLDQHALR